MLRNESYMTPTAHEHASARLQPSQPAGLSTLDGSHEKAGSRMTVQTARTTEDIYKEWDRDLHTLSVSV